MVGYCLLNRKDEYIYYAVQKVIPDYESLAVNAAIVYQVLVDHQLFLESGGYICDGSRNILHETRFQDYLEKYFEFRKAYCTLHCKYRFPIGAVVKLLYYFRSIIYKHDSNRLCSNISAVLKMEEVIRRQNKSIGSNNKVKP